MNSDYCFLSRTYNKYPLIYFFFRLQYIHALELDPTIDSPNALDLLVRQLFELHQINRLIIDFWDFPFGSRVVDGKLLGERGIFDQHDSTTERFETIKTIFTGLPKSP